MKFCYPEINKTFDCSEAVWEIVIENQSLFTALVRDISRQIQGRDGKSVVSNNDKSLPFAKNVELINSFVPFDINRKTLVNKLTNQLCDNAISDKNYADSVSLMTELETYLFNIANDSEGSITFNKCNIESIIKAVSPAFENEYESLAEAIIDYIELVRAYEQDKVFIIVNLRSYITDEECLMMVDDIIRKHFNCILIESVERSILQNTKRLIIDKDLCEI